MSYPKKNFQGPARNSFFEYDNDKELKAHFLMTQLNYVLMIVIVLHHCCGGAFKVIDFVYLSVHQSPTSVL